ncbi:MAG: radical SAM protein [Candidatus Aminicenantes bacterium]|nr:radical SAM protein [Candidatus Aminicenantes bacterium]NIM81918.1 radical SAM protein [Candidatus Aminicenantes bacterium]NIN21295.1 radical SAM protein [Candidatus Aminicenantes bacterium]NIN45116.1 radical SAM protein [Candidatus Aminicenantes bacterium]NIN87933.1 radical SAM protein [Candidatus Aminicenantes bacterium]
MKEKIRFFHDKYSPCCLCPRQCGAEREKNKAGVCGARKDVKVASYNIHSGEEPPVSGTRGSGTVFFSGCTLKCIYCQNYPISHLLNGEFYSIEELSDIFLHLQTRGAHNINLVTATPYLYHIVHALSLASQKGLNIPIVYNTSGYERPEIVTALNDSIDVYMPDLKYADSEVSLKYTGVSNYLEYAYPAIEEMFKQVGLLQMDEEGIARKGLILRHLILPQNIENSKKVLKIISESPFRDSHLSLMSQYFPAYKAAQEPEINRCLYPEEYQEVKDYALELGFSTGWFQDMDAQGGA